MLKIDLYKNKNQESRQYGKVYGRATLNKPIDLEGLALHILEHGSPWTEDIVLGVLKKASTCIRELALRGEQVKLDGLCIVRCHVTSTPAVSVEKFDLGQNIRNVRMQFRAANNCRPKLLTAAAELGYTSMAQRLKAGEATLSNEKGKYLEAEGV